MTMSLSGESGLLLEAFSPHICRNSPNCGEGSVTISHIYVYLYIVIYDALKKAGAQALDLALASFEFVSIEKRRESRLDAFELNHSHRFSARRDVTVARHVHAVAARRRPEQLVFLCNALIGRPVHATPYRGSVE